MNTIFRARINCSDTAEQQKFWKFRLVMSLGVTYINVRSAILVLLITFASVGKGGFLIVLFCTLILSGIIVTLENWNRTENDPTDLLTNGNKTIFTFLALGITALFVKVLFEQTEIEPKAYVVRVLL